MYIPTVIRLSLECYKINMFRPFLILHHFVLLLQSKIHISGNKDILFQPFLCKYNSLWRQMRKNK